MTTDKVLRASLESINYVHDYATSKGITVKAAADSLIATARSRLEALSRYGKTGRKLLAKKKPAAKKATARKRSRTPAS